MIETAHGEIVIKRRLESVAEVRRFVRLTLGRWEIDDFVPCLVASELVTNAIQHATTCADDDVTMRLSLADDGSLWLEVQDTSCIGPCMRPVELTSESGRGLFVVEQFTRCWGTRPLAGGAGKVVFAVLEP
ncbi:ATP-binding protein [Actinomadura sp. 6N118]|uniref:ATP-binding protein n=1 Tax=Actinomadura sp. 6N118 TaxID=3375151 RepID=UPI0037B2EAAD